MNKHCDEQKELDIYIGKRLRFIRQKLGLTLLEVAKKLGISLQQVQKYEQAQSRISATTLHQLGEIMGVESKFFFQGFLTFKKKLNFTTSDTVIPDYESVLNVLLVENDVADEFLTRRALSECSVNVNLFVLHDGEAVIDFLRNRLVSTNFPRPDIILLDLSIPKRDGENVLREIKRDKTLSDIPVIIMTNKINFQDMVSCYKAYASGYICKPYDYDVFLNLLNTLANYWAKSVVLPNRSHGLAD
ncbi:MAG: response regulator [Candidatus Paracaedibacteraceae bacterium]|nr:response regulator [Candidatus Paracaedibacteraceae bacterium]